MQASQLLRGEVFRWVELKSSSSRFAAKRLLQRELSNVMVVNMEAHKYVSNWVSDCVFDVVHIYFPTPYPLSIGLPHRLINSSFTTEVHRILKPSGTLRIVTDDKGYYEEICGHLNARHWWAVDWQPLELTVNNYLVGTRQEVVYRETNHPQLYALQLIRI